MIATIYTHHVSSTTGDGTVIVIISGDCITCRPDIPKPPPPEIYAIRRSFTDTYYWEDEKLLVLDAPKPPRQRPRQEVARHQTMLTHRHMRFLQGPGCRGGLR